MIRKATLAGCCLALALTAETMAQTANSREPAKVATSAHVPKSAPPAGKTLFLIAPDLDSADGHFKSVGPTPASWCRGGASGSLKVP